MTNTVKPRRVIRTSPNPSSAPNLFVRTRPLNAEERQRQYDKVEKLEKFGSNAISSLVIVEIVLLTINELLNKSEVAVTDKNEVGIMNVFFVLSQTLMGLALLLSASLILFSKLAKKFNVADTSFIMEVGERQALQNQNENPDILDQHFNNGMG